MGTVSAGAATAFGSEMPYGRGVGSATIMLPGWRDWAFALKTFAAAMLALFLALWLDLPRPYWALATVYITSQVLAGATRAKAFYRVGGTLIGAVVAVALVPNLVTAPVLLSLAIALWVGLCLAIALLDRTPASYLPMLAGYTTALIGFPAVSDPGAIFDTAVARAQEITLGIVCASLFATLVLPQSAAPTIAARLDAWLAQARGWTQEALKGARAGGEATVRRLRLASDAIALDALALSLRHETSGAERSAPALRALRQHMLMVLPIVEAVADRIGALERAGAMPPELRALLSDLSDWLASGNEDPEAARALRARLDAIEPVIVAGSGWDTLLRASLVERLRDFVDLRQDMRGLRRDILEDRAPRHPPAFRYTARARDMRHRDRQLAVTSALGAIVAILLACAIWIGTAWPDGYAAPMMAAVACSLFAAQDDPARAILAFANSAMLGALGAGLTLFAVLPVVSTFEMLALALAPGLILCGLMMTQPSLAPIGMGAAVNGSTMIALQNGYGGDFSAFANSAIAVIAGMWLAALTLRLWRSIGSAGAVHRLVRLNRDGLARAATGRGRQDGLELAALMLDRVGLIAPRLASLPPEDAARLGDLLAEIRLAINVVALRRIRRDLPREARAAVARVLIGVARRDEHVGGPERPDLLARIDDALDVVLAGRTLPARRAAAIGLTGLRQALAPDASAYRGAISDRGAAA